MKRYDKEIVRTSDRQLAEVLSINKELTEKSLRMRCLSSLAEVKSALLTQTVYEIDRSKKILKQVNLDLTSSQINLKKQQQIMDVRKAELERHVAERTADLRHANRSLREEIERRSESEKRLLLFRNLAREGTALFPGTHMRKDGTTFPVEVNVSYIREEAQPYLVAVVRNITERKKLEGQFLQAQKMEAIGRFAGGIAHDFNNLLTAIIGYSELLLLERTPESRDYEDIKTIRETADRAAQLTRQILAFSKRQVMEPTLLDLNQIVREMSKIFTRLLGEDIEFTFEAGKNLQNIKADPGQVEQVILNLVVNARDAMPEGGCLTIKTESIHIDEAFAETHAGVLPGRYLLLSITDSGIGMDEEMQNHIFDPYFTTKDEGTGLGLSTVYGIVQQNKGFVHVYSEVGEGTTFKIYLPAVKEEMGKRSKSSGEEAKLPTGSETLLIVEDEQTILTLATQVLESLGYRILTAMSGEEALKLLAKSGTSPDLLLSDVVLPGMRGPEMAGKIRERHPGIKVLFMSGYTDQRIAEPGGPAERPEFLAKPFTPSRLARKVRAVLDGRAEDGIEES